jgi:hypothetical protein
LRQRPGTISRAALLLTARVEEIVCVFWDCINGIRARNVYELFVRFNIFRSTHDCSLAFTTLPIRGENGIDYETNRFKFSAEESQFNNLKFGINFRTPQLMLPYDMTGTGPNLGVYADMVSLNRNYFGPLVTSTVAYSWGAANAPGSEYLGDAIRLSTPNTIAWTQGLDPASGNPYLSLINSNRMDRTFRGITINSFADSPLSVGGNSITVENDYTFGSPQVGHGIAAMNNAGNLAIQNNTVEAVVPWYNPPFNANLSAIYCNLNSGVQSPVIQCNFVTGSQFGFKFDDQNPNTVWQANHMCKNSAGMALVNNGIIGPQGNANLGCGNMWSTNCSNWGSPNGPAYNQTYVENSNPNLSPLYVLNPPFNASYVPTFNGVNQNSPFQPYSLPSTILDVAPSNYGNDCWVAYAYPSVPGWRIAGSMKPLKDDDLNENLIKLFPNPTNGNLTIVTGISEPVTLRVLDMAGREVYVTVTSGNQTEIDISSLAPSIYVIELNRNNKVLRKKLIKTTKEN